MFIFLKEKCPHWQCMIGLGTPCSYLCAQIPKSRVGHFRSNILDILSHVSNFISTVNSNYIITLSAMANSKVKIFMMNTIYMDVLLELMLEIYFPQQDSSFLIKNLLTHSFLGNERDNSEQN